MPVNTAPSGVTDRWARKLKTRTGLLAAATRDVATWAPKAGSAHGRAKLEQAKARRSLRRRQVDAAERVLARHGQVTRVSDEGLAFIAGREGFSGKPYRDPVGVWTIGYGETAGVTAQTRPWSREYALKHLRSRVDSDYLSAVLRACERYGFEPTQHEADALASLVYNLGPAILAPERSMGAALKLGDRQRIADAFLAYDKAGVPPRTLPGLTLRRRAERAMFLGK